MNFFEFIVRFLKDPRTVLAGWITALGAFWVYTPLFLVVFIETGVVFFPFLPGDSLIFAAGVFCGDPIYDLSLIPCLIVFIAAAILGNTSNYFIARFFGKAIIDSGKAKAMTPERMAKLDGFFEKYGGLTIVITRFMPFFRTFAPFVAGMGHMNFGKFTLYNAIGGVSWVCLFLLTGYFFGGVPFVQEHFELIVLGIVAVSVAPAVYGAIRGAVAGWRAKHAAVDQLFDNPDRVDFTVEVSAESFVGEEAPAEETPAEEAPAEETPAEEAPAEPAAEPEPVAEPVAEPEPETPETHGKHEAYMGRHVRR